MNKAAGLPFWGTVPLWVETDEGVAQRLGWPRESKTSTLASYRLYPSSPVRVFGRDAYTMALYAEGGRPTEISIVFANKGDVSQMTGVWRGARDREIRAAARDYGKLIREDARQINETLSHLLGPPTRLRVGDSPQTREVVHRWDWRGHSLLLSWPRDEYVRLRILASEQIDSSGIEKIRRSELRSTLASRVERRPNGDVILTDMPMVNQGPKGYCVPATWERVLRYMGIPADMYVLAMAAETGVWGGTSTRAMTEGANRLVRRYGRRIKAQQRKIRVHAVSRYIDEGVPIIWTMYSTPEFKQRSAARMKARTDVTDWDQWVQELRPVRRGAKRDLAQRSNPHVCLIIGYNPQTEEVATSDSWGPEYAERWVTVEEAEAVSQGEFFVVLP